MNTFCFKMFFLQTHIYLSSHLKHQVFIINNYVTLMFNIVLIVDKPFEQISQ
jgi:hypothetical protein